MSIGGVGGSRPVGPTGPDVATIAGPPADTGAAASTAVRGSGLAGRMAVLASVTTQPAPAAAAVPQTIDDVAARVAALPRRPLEPGFEEGLLPQIAKRLEGRVTDNEVERILHELDLLEPAAWLTMIQTLGSAPSDEAGMSQLDKLVRYGVNDRNHLIASFADQANRKLGLGLPSLEDRADALEAGGMREGKAERLAGREVRSESEAVLAYFGANDRQGFWNGVRNAARDTGTTLGVIVSLPLVLIGLGRGEL